MENNEYINQPANQPIDQQTTQPINPPPESGGESTGKPTRESTSRADECPTSRPVYQKMDGVDRACCRCYRQWFESWYS